jgi:hypothetical protein
MPWCDISSVLQVHKDQLVLFRIHVLTNICVITSAMNDIDQLKPGLPAFIFDKDKKHDEIVVREGGRVAEKTDGEDYQSVLLRPAIPKHGR